MKTIYLNKIGKYAMVDDEDYKLLKNYRWYYHSERYAFRHQTNEKRLKSIYLHNEIMEPVKGQQVHFLDGNSLNCQRSNLILLPISTCRHMATPSKSKTCRFKGVRFDNKTGSYLANIKENGKNKYLGTFTIPTYAALAYDRAARRIYGPYAYQNLPEWVRSL
jgi:hypothetical protein